MKPLLATLCFALILFSSCSKKSEDPAAATVPVRIEISPAVQSTAVGTTATFQLRYFNDMGVQAPIPGNVNWSSSNTGIATINGQGQATGIDFLLDFRQYRFGNGIEFRAGDRTCIWYGQRDRIG